MVEYLFIVELGSSYHRGPVRSAGGALLLSLRLFARETLADS